MSLFTKISPVVAESFRAGGRTDGRTDMQAGRRKNVTKLLVAFHNFANVPKAGELMMCMEISAVFP
jgi:hypothetical protein